MKSETQNDYVKRIKQVLNHLAKSLDGPLDLRRLAEEACLSPYHFHRIYVAITGETITDTVRRLRLQRAGIDLLANRLPIPRIARGAGYSTVQAFGRAFRTAYGIPPAAYRKRGGLHGAKSHPLAIPVDDPHRYAVSVEMFSSISVMASRHQGPYDGLPYAFEHLVNWAASNGCLGPRSRVFSVFHDDPTVTVPSQLRFDACISLPVDSPFSIATIPGGRCAVVVCRGPFHETEGVLNWLCGCWLPAHDEVPNDLPVFMEHLGNPRTTPPAELVSRIYLPLEE